MIIIFTEEDIDNVIKDLNIKFDKFSKKDFITGLNVELEHGLVDSNTNVTNNDIMKTAKIALAHLNEFPNYYNSEYGLTIFEKYLKYRLNN
ncbi:MAG: DUF5661 family protein [Bacilli bacterium]